MSGSVDTRQAEAALKAVMMDTNSLLRIEGAGAAVQINGQRMRVPVDTAATKNSVGSHIESAGNGQVVDQIGPETGYAPFVEYGVQSKPNYPIQPFVRPTESEDGQKTVNAIARALGEELRQKWPK